MFVRHHVTYQGYPCVGVSFRRSDGLDPDTGWVDINFADLASANPDTGALEIKIRARSIPWTPVNGQEMEGPVSPQAWAALPQISTVDTPPNPNDEAPAGGGLDHFGKLVMRTVNVDTGEDIAAPAVYEFVYIDSSGLDQSQRELARGAINGQGVVRVPLTDMRKFYADNGPVVCRMNSKGKGGTWDARTLHPGGGQPRPFTLREGILFLFSQVPGTPTVTFSHILANDPILSQSCPEILGHGEPAREHITKLLDRVGITAGMLPTGNFRLVHRGVNGLPYPNIATWRDTHESLSDIKHYESVATALPDRTPSVLVIGKPIVRRITLNYTPVIQDTDGLYYQLKDIEKLWGYPLALLNKQVLNRSREFNNCPPLSGSGVRNGLKQARINILKRCAYKTYAPLIAFHEAKKKGGQGVPALSGEDLGEQSFLPAGPAPVYMSEFSDIFRAPPLVEGDKGDLDRYLLIPPFARAYRLGEGWWKDFDAVREEFLELIAVGRTLEGIYADILRSLESLSNGYKKLVARQQATMTNPKGWRGTTPAGEAYETLDKIFKDAVINPTGNEYGNKLKIDADVEIARDKLRGLKDIGTDRSVFLAPHDKVIETMSDADLSSLIAIGKLIGSQEAVKGEQAKITKQIALWEKEMGLLEQKHQQLGGLTMRMQLPWGPLPAGAFSFDSKTGILQSSEPLCTTTRPFFFTGDSEAVSGDGNVLVTFGYEAFGSDIRDYTSVLLAVDGDEKGGEAVICGGNRPSPIKGRSVIHPTMRAYLDDAGNYMNSQEVEAAALDKAAGMLTVPTVQEGYNYQFNGLVRVVLDGGTNFVEHIWEPATNALALTRVAVNSPGSRGYRPKVRIPSVPRRVEATEAIERSHENFA